MLDFAALVLALAATVAVHELGHYTAARGLGYPATLGLRTTGWGSDAVTSPARHRRDVAAAGPIANLLYAAVAMQAGAYWLAFLSALFAAINLVPFKGSDGHHILHP